jgi:hypothetical protein
MILETGRFIIQPVDTVLDLLIARAAGRGAVRELANVSIHDGVTNLQLPP